MKQPYLSENTEMPNSVSTVWLFTNIFRVALITIVKICGGLLIFCLVERATRNKSLPTEKQTLPVSKYGVFDHGMAR